ncbi:MAG: hypothetical protein SVY53_12140 [Chloroflexota bacterium]|nr:hypothetical protein [Chloroflexota bacterium]
MARLTPNDTYVIRKEFPEPFGEYEIEIKRYWSGGDQDYIINHQLSMDITMGDDGKAQMSPMRIKTSRIAMAKRIIQTWNVEDDAGNAVPITEGNIQQLPEDVLDWVLTEWQVEQERQKKSLTPTIPTSKIESSTS